MAVYTVEGRERNVDIFLEKLDQPRIFEWNLFHHIFNSRSLFDLDGVLCVDGPPEREEIKDEYISYIKSAKPLLIPTKKLGGIVTSRLEKYRSITVQWLAEHNVQYDHLFMLNIETAEQRRKLGLHALYKADVYEKIGGMLFVESEAWQAEAIFQLKRRPVYCFSTGKMHTV
jgi:uncharacterized HAD superfamily protein